jgi:hypothetical protein
MKTCPPGSNDAVWYHLSTDVVPVTVNSVAVTAMVTVRLKEELALDVATTW